MEDIKKWLSDPNRDYQTGVMLFSLASGNKNLVRFFQSGTARFRMPKLIYELGKLVKGSKPIATSVVSIARDIKPAAAVLRHDVPDVILAAKKEISSLYSIIDKRHSELYALGTSNSKATVQKRKKILEDRKPVIERADRLYRLKEEWFAMEDGPARERVANDIREMLAAPLGAQPSIVETGRTPSLPVVSKMSDIDLSKRRSALRSSITKTQNMLQYQTIRKGDSPTPMPPGPKRDEYEQKLKALKTEFKAVTEELARRAAN